MTIPPAISAHERKKRKTVMREILFRALACVAVGAVGFWYPLWVVLRMAHGADDRSGFVFVYGLFAILFVALWTTFGIRRLSTGISGPLRFSVMVIVAICWAPFGFMAIMIARMFVLSLLGSS
jgi:hypothetical protein